MIGSVKGSMRERLVEAASELFYSEGLRAVSVDKVIQHAGTTKVTFYRHFKSKDDLIVAHLELKAQQERDGINGAITKQAETPTVHSVSSPTSSEPSLPARVPRLPVHQCGSRVP